MSYLESPTVVPLTDGGTLGALINAWNKLSMLAEAVAITPAESCYVFLCSETKTLVRHSLATSDWPALPTATSPFFVVRFPVLCHGLPSWCVSCMQSYRLMDTWRVNLATQESDGWCGRTLPLSLLNLQQRSEAINLDTGHDSDFTEKRGSISHVSIYPCPLSAWSSWWNVCVEVVMVHGVRCEQSITQWNHCCTANTGCTSDLICLMAAHFGPEKQTPPCNSLLM